MSSPTVSSGIDLLAWLAELGDTQSQNAHQWQIHKAQLTQSLIQQDLPIKLIYHYEKLDEDIKAQFPLNGTLLKQFNTPMTRAGFADLPQLTGLSLQAVARPWQLKFMGKLVIFTQNPEVAIRLWWTNTLKEFELVYTHNPNEAIEASFHHWQFVDSVEVICKTPDITLTAQTEESLWQMSASQAFEPVPAVTSLAIQTILNDNEFVNEHWLPQLIDLAKGQMALLDLDNE